MIRPGGSCSGEPQTHVSAPQVPRNQQQPDCARSRLGRVAGNSDLFETLLAGEHIHPQRSRDCVDRVSQMGHSGNPVPTVCAHLGHVMHWDGEPSSQTGMSCKPRERGGNALGCPTFVDAWPHMIITVGNMPPNVRCPRWRWRWSVPANLAMLRKSVHMDVVAGQHCPARRLHDRAGRHFDEQQLWIDGDEGSDSLQEVRLVVFVPWHHRANLERVAIAAHSTKDEPITLRMLSRCVLCYVVTRSIKTLGRGTARLSSRMKAKLCPCDACTYANIGRTRNATLSPAWRRVWGARQRTAIKELGLERLPTP